MREYLSEGDLMAAEIQQISNRDGRISLHIRSDDFGKLKIGVVARICHDLVKKQPNHLIRLNMGVKVVVAMNGNIWLEPLDSENISSEVFEKIAKLKNIIELFDQFFVALRIEDVLMVFNELSNNRAADLGTDEIKTRVLKILGKAVNERSVTQLKELIMS